MQMSAAPSVPLPASAPLPSSVEDVVMTASELLSVLDTELSETMVIVPMLADGAADGAALRTVLVFADADADGTALAEADGAADDAVDGAADGVPDGARDGERDGAMVGAADGADGAADGAALGEVDGAILSPLSLSMRPVELPAGGGDGGTAVVSQAAIHCARLSTSDPYGQGTIRALTLASPS